ncbi:hypothetical protein OEA41_007011 [Lepraria neglecta]|uniref:Uncharacterized protein n=1 Tax=Lepraria neglecta TaxID=209136 RepID=A0AAE0DKZ2_9LECA|nr:hypothetical protein OEA41_007011 [Lepraria neglecta]
MFPSTFLAILLPLISTANAIFCSECGVNGIFYVDTGCTNGTYVAPLFGGDAGECFEIGAPYTDKIDEVAHMPFGKTTMTKSVLVDYSKDNCEVFFYPGLVCKSNTGMKVDLGSCANDESDSGWGSFCVSCPAGSSVMGAGVTCPPVK